MRQFNSLPSAHVLHPSIIVLMALATLPAPFATAQADDAARPKVINVEVMIDPSKTGQERCVVEPEDLQIPVGTSTITWAMVTGNSGASDSTETELDNVGFSSSLPVTVSERVDAQRWRVTFDREEAFAQIPYDVIVREANGTVTECYPHVAGSTDQGGGGGS